MKKIICLLVCLFAGSANAAIVYSNTELSGAFETESFDTNAGHNSAAASQFSGITFGAGNFISNSYSGAFPNMTNSVISNFSNNNAPYQDPSSFFFDFDLSDLAFAFVSNPQTTTVSAYLDNIFIESSSLNTNYSGQYVNISGITFDEIRITSTGANDAYILDDMQFRAVPEPTSIALIGLGLVGVSLSRKKKTA